jgi:hypothetical protein
MLKIDTWVREWSSGKNKAIKIEAKTLKVIEIKDLKLRKNE